MLNYKEILERNLPRLISHFDLNRGSTSYGQADRLFWGWKVSDFPNSTFQGGVHALAIASRLQLIDTDYALHILDASVRAIPSVRSSNGSMQEAYPMEHSFCVTALVIFDVLSAINRLATELSEDLKREYFAILKPSVAFIVKHGEEHAIISNHLATGVAAIALWNKLTGEGLTRHQELLSIIYQHQSAEGWHKEYEGADPGYQTLGLYYLCAAHEAWPDAQLLESIKKAADFNGYFIHPDGSIGGLYGSRNTEVYYPGGMAYLARMDGAYSSAEKALAIGQHVMPDQIDPGNYIPILNAYAFAAFHASQSNAEHGVSTDLPYQQSFTKDFSEAGVFIKSTAVYYAIVNYKKGGTLKVFDKSNSLLSLEDGGLYGTLNSGDGFSTQVWQPELDFSDQKIETRFAKIADSQSPNALTTIIVRAMSLTIFRSVYLGNLFKKAVVKLLMTGKNFLDGKAVRHFIFSEGRIEVHDQITTPKSSSGVRHGGKFTSIHMASSGYFMQNTLRQSTTEIVTFHGVDS